MTIPYKWYPGTRVLDQAFLWRLLDLERGRRAADRPRDRDEVPGLLRPASEQGRVDRCTSSGRPTTTTATEFGQFSESPEDRATRLAVERLDRVALGEARQGVRDLAERRRAARALHRASRRRYLPPPPQKLAYRTAEPEPFVLSVNRLDRAKRIDLLIEAAKLDPSLRIVITGDGPDRERLERLAVGAERPGRVHRPRRRRAARRPVRALPRRLLRAGRRGLRDGAVRGVPVREARRDDDRRGRAARDRPRPRDGRRRRARRRAELARGVRVPRRRTSTRRRPGAAPGKAVAERVTWDACIDALLVVKVAYYSPLPPSRSGIADYSALLLPALRERVEEVVVARAGQAARRRRTSRSTTSATTPTRTAGSWTRCASGPASSSCTSSSCTT